MVFRGTACCRVLCGALLASLICCPTMASDPPDSQVNPQTAYIETVFSSSRGTNSDIMIAIDPGEGDPPLVEVLTTASEDDLRARLVISASGDTWVVWFRHAESDQVLIRKHVHGGSWTDEEFVSSEEGGSRSPEITHDGANPWVIFERDDIAGTSIAVRAIHDDPNPFDDLTVLGTTDYNGDLNVLIQSAGGHLWATWVDSTWEVGWSEYDYASEAWEVVSYESYESDTIEDARSRIKSTVLGN